MVRCAIADTLLKCGIDAVYSGDALLLFFGLVRC